jgi:hypothetical protein
MNKNQGKIFCIGFHKTGTKSLTSSLRQLGLKVKGRFGVNDYNIQHNALIKAEKLISKFDAFQDNPWPLLYKDLDKLAPNSKFILTVRNSESWLNSVVRYFGASETEMRKWIYGFGSPINNEEAYLSTYEAHNNSVMQYFSNRESDLLVMDLEQGSGWNELCSFLKIDQIPQVSFPHINKTKNHE